MPLTLEGGTTASSWCGQAGGVMYGDLSTLRRINALFQPNTLKFETCTATALSLSAWARSQMIT